MHSQSTKKPGIRTPWVAKCDPLDDQEYFNLVGTTVRPLSAVSGNVILKKLDGALRAQQVSRVVELAECLVSQQYDTASEHFEAHQVASLLRKYPYSSSPFDPEGAARKKFLAGERLCRQYNRKIRLWKSVPRIDKGRPHVSAFARAREWIARTLGEFSLAENLAECDFSGGAALGVHGNATNLYRKFQAESWSCTLNALSYAKEALWSNVHARHVVLPGRMKCYDTDKFGALVDKRVVVTNANKLSFVPKTVKVHRTIAVEPLLNIFVQKGSDKVIRRRLLRAGIDLRTQKRNMQLAQAGSEAWLEEDPWVTIDLANASGSICKELVKWLLPVDWFVHLDALRSYSYEQDGKEVLYESFCSMGNGYCFSLETLIFSAFCQAAGCGDEFSVYGDDIIVKRSKALYLIELLHYFGFRTNVEKTFITGPFRESCGADWYGGEDVRPMIMDARFDDCSNFFSIHNGTLRNKRTEAFFESWRPKLRDRVHEVVRFVGLSGQHPDSYFVVPLDLAMSSRHFRWDREVQAWQWKKLQASPMPDTDADRYATQDVDMYAMLRGAISANAENDWQTQATYTLRYTAKRKIKWTYAPSEEGSLGAQIFSELKRRPTLGYWWAYSRA